LTAHFAPFFHTEFSISAEALEELTVFVNQHGDLYDQGIAFGGVNGVAVKNISGECFECVISS
jgi:hypothetical protein